MLIGIFEYQQEHFGIIFSQSFICTEIEQQIGDGVITNDEESLKFHTAINF